MWCNLQIHSAYSKTQVVVIAATIDEEEKEGKKQYGTQNNSSRMSRKRQTCNNKMNKFVKQEWFGTKEY